MVRARSVLRSGRSTFLDPAVSNGQRIERRVKQIEENTEFDILDCSEVEYTPSEGERTSQDYVAVPKNKHGGLLQLFLPNLIEHEQLIRNRVVRALHCTTKGETRQRSFLLEVNEQPCEIRPIASEGSTELRYLHSTQNLYDYMLTYGNDAVLYVKLLRGKRARAARTTASPSFSFSSQAIRRSKPLNSTATWS